MTKPASRRGRAAQNAYAVHPIDVYPHNSRERLLDETLRPEDTIDLYGHCAAFCADDREPSGLTVAEHGPWCGSVAAVFVDGKDSDGERFSIAGNLVRLYTHGVYAHAELRSDLPRWHDPFVRLSLIGKNAAMDKGDDEAATVLLPAGEVRRMAAALLHLADTADRLLDDMNESKARRRRDT